MGCSACEQRRSAMEQAKHLAQSVAQSAVKGISGEQVLASKEQQKERLQICENCDKVMRFHDLPVGSSITLKDRCGKCGCFIRGKVTLAVESCPLGKWSQIE